MTNSKSTKRALLTSALAMLMCVAMLIGTTFAWFTDTASTAVNKIQAGNLDVELLDKNGATLAEDAKLTWVKADGHADEEVLWEPNCTYDLDQFQIKNAGNLALKYKVVLKATEITDKDGKSLLDVIEWTVKAGDETIKENVLFDDLGADNGIAIIDGEKLLANKTVKISVTGHMKSDAGNEYQNLSIDGFGITVYAAQVNEEYDSNGNTYDIQATYDSSAPKTPLVVKVGTADELQAALNVFSSASAGTNVVELTQDFNIGTATWSSVHLDGYQGVTNVTIKGNGHKITGLNAPLFEGGFAGDGTLTIQDLTIENSNISVSSTMGVGAFVGTADNLGGITLDNCHVTGGSVVNTDSYAGGLIGYSSTSVTMTDCSVTNCTITGNGSVGGFIGHLTKTSTISGTVTNCTVTGANAGKTGIVVGTVNPENNQTITMTATGSENKAGTNSDSLTNLVGRFVIPNGNSGTLKVGNSTYTSSVFNNSYTSNKLN